MRRKVQSVSVLDEVPDDAYRFLAHSFKRAKVPAGEAERLARLKSLDKVINDMINRGETPTGLDDSVELWITLKLCIDEQMRKPWSALQAMRTRGSHTELGRKEEPNVGRLFLSYAGHMNELSVPRTSRWIREWEADLERVTKEFCDVIFRWKGYDDVAHLLWTSGHEDANKLLIDKRLKAQDREDGRLSSMLRKYVAHIKSLKTSHGPGKRNDFEAKRWAYARSLNSYVRYHIGDRFESLTAACVTVIFGKPYSTKQLRRDIETRQNRPNDLAIVSAKAADASKSGA